MRLHAAPGTSPLYLWPSVFPNGVADAEDVVGACSIVLWTLTLIVIVKYLVSAMAAPFLQK